MGIDESKKRSGGTTNERVGILKKLKNASDNENGRC